MVLTRTLRILGSAAAAGALLLTTPPTATADQVRNDQWPLQAFDADKIWQLATGKGITVAVIDDGVDAHHPDLAGNILPGKDFIDGDSDASPAPGDDHGTGMAGIIAGHGHGAGGTDGVMGLAPEAKILPIRDRGSDSDGFALSIKYAVDQGASVINISQGGGSRPDGDSEFEAVKYALQRNVVIVTSSGNDGKSGADAIGYPGIYPDVVNVGAVQSSGEIWEKSNSGPNLMLSAPGDGIVSTGTDADGYRMGTGTSDSAAFVSAAAALLREKFPDLTAGQIVNRLTKTAGLPSSAKGIKLPDEKYGYGYIQPLAALKNNIPPGPANGPLIMPAPSAPSATDDSNNGSNSAAAGDSESGTHLARSAVYLIAAVVVLLIAGVVALVIISGKKRKRHAAEQRIHGQGYGSYPQQQTPYPPQSHPHPYQQQPPPPAPPNQQPPGYNPYQQ
ncbi:type VII secretion-associated serine protease mycosin [Streptomyces sp. NPDC051569]|uniref:type VII secretion-associated serine protease mycosin n=1 Tax=Streptomyces sp. NPDC051569 TaxID=3365661 RepID=UPI00379F49C6